MKKILFAFVLVALASASFAQSADEQKQLDVIIRDFSVTHSDFENYHGVKASRTSIEGVAVPGAQDFQTCADDKKTVWANNAARDVSDARNVEGSMMIGMDYRPHAPGSLTQFTQLKPIMYGQRTNANGKRKRGYIHELKEQGYNTKANGPWGACPGHDPDFPNNSTIENCQDNQKVKVAWYDWSQEVYVTTGMVNSRLDYSDCGADAKDLADSAYCARPTRANVRCYNENFDDWFRDRPNNKRIEDMMTFNLQSDGKYMIEHDWNGRVLNASTGEYEGYSGYFPLDDEAKYPDTYGKQTLAVFCPTYGVTNWYGDGTEGQGDIDPVQWRACLNWLGQPVNIDRAKNETAASTVNGEFQSLRRNYGFTMQGVGIFKYTGTDDIFEFVGDDDMWIFIDGNLVADLGGMHAAAPAKLSMKELADVYDWKVGSDHAINFYYADRQSDGSNMKLRMSLSNLLPPRFGGPQIKKAKTTLNADGSAETLIWVSTILADNFRNFIGSGMFPIIVTKPGDPERNIYGYRIDAIETDFSNPTRDGSSYVYKIIGAVCLDATCSKTQVLNSGDSLSFNVRNDDLMAAGYNQFFFGFPNEDSYVTARNGAKADKVAWGINSTDLPAIDPKPEVTDKNPVKPDFETPTGGPSQGSPTGNDPRDPSVPGGSGGLVGNVGGIGNNSGNFPNVGMVWDPDQGKMVVPNQNIGASTDNTVNGFGTVGNQIPPQRAGELILTALPSNLDANAYNEWMNNPDHKFFGLPPTAAGGDKWWGEADPTMPAKVDNITTGGHAFVKNGFPNESNAKGVVKVSPTRCTSKIVDGEPRINCLNFSLLAKQPFQLSVTVYDQLGNFVTQYREKITSQEFRNITQASAFLDKSKLNPTMTNGDCALPGSSTDGPGSYGHPNTMTTNGYVNVNVNIYPFSTTGRRFGNGVYILKIDRVDLPFDEGGSCAMANGAAQWIQPEFIRYHADQKFGWMRATTNKK